MPELPEVEVTRRELLPLLLHRRLAHVVATPGGPLFLTAPRILERRLAGRRFVSLERIGKHLIAGLDDGGRLLLHLGMTGRIVGTDRPRKPGAHAHLVLCFRDNGPAVVFHDPRKFGRIELLAPGEASPRLDRLGPDALQVRAGLLHHATRLRRAAIKSFLLDQSVVAGIGNIYADEALFLARLRPTRRAHRLGRDDCSRLAAAIRRVLRRAIRTGGTTISDFVRPNGRSGGYQDERWVYGRGGEPCRNCGQRIRRLLIGQRSTHYCPGCQR